MKYSPHDYQKYAEEFVLQHPYCALFQECGLGKTVTTLTAIERLMFDSLEVNHVLVIAPLRVARDTWIAERDKWDHLRFLRIERVLGTAKQRIDALNRSADIHVINRENVEWLVKHYGSRRMPFELVVIDELSSFKNAKSKRFKEIKKVRPQFSRVIGLTGTPAPNGLEDLWSQIYLLDGGRRLCRTKYAFMDTFFEPATVYQPYDRKPKPGAEQEIYRRLSDICVSMKAADHLRMPDRIDNMVEVVLSPAELKVYKRLERDMLLKYSDGDIVATTAATLAGKLLQLANGAAYNEHQEACLVHDRKLEALEDLVEAANGKPVLVLYGYKHDLARITERLKAYRPRELKTSEDLVDWNAGRIQVAVTHPASTGHGLNLQQGGSTMIWFGLTWSLELYEQACARLWRQGQQNTVVIHHIVAKGTMDEQVITALQRKATDQQALMEAVKVRMLEAAC